MEFLFWILLSGVAVFFAVMIVSVIIGGILSTKEKRNFAGKYISEGLIDDDQKAELPVILLEKGKKMLESGEVLKALQYLNDCIELSKLNELNDIKDSANVELCKCYIKTQNDEKALSIIYHVFTPEAYLLRGELLLKRNHKYDIDEAVKCAGKAMECEGLRERAQSLLQKAEAITDENNRQKACERFEIAIRNCKKLDMNPSVTSVLYITPGQHFKRLGYYLDMYNDITKYVSEEQRKNYSKELSLIAFQIASMCCSYGFHESAYAYLQKDTSDDLPQKDFLYAMIYARTGPEGLYRFAIHYPKDVVEEYKNKLEKASLPARDFDKALEYANHALQSGIKEASKLITVIEVAREQSEYYDALRHAQNIWDKQFEEEHGMTRDEYDEYLEERRMAELEKQELGAEQAAKRLARQKRLESDIDISEMLYDKTHDGTGKTMDEKWRMGEITAEEYHEYKNKRDQYVDTF